MSKPTTRRKLVFHFKFYLWALTIIRSLIRAIGAASTVLLKNTNGVLPLVTPETATVLPRRESSAMTCKLTRRDMKLAPRTIAIIGNGAGNSSRGANGYVRSVESRLYTGSSSFQILRSLRRRWRTCPGVG